MNKTIGGYEKFLRVLSFVGALWLWNKSVGFSIIGFGLEAGTPVDAKSVGLGFALMFTLMQLIWNRMRGDMSNLTLFVFGLFAYVYSILTNYTGFGDWIGVDNVWSTAGILSVKGILNVIISLMMEVLPEPLFLWSITGRFDGGDLLSNIFTPPSQNAFESLPTKRHQPYNTSHQTQENAKESDKELREFLKSNNGSPRKNYR